MQNKQINYVEQVVEESRTEMNSKWLTFWLDKQLFGVSIEVVEQIVSMQPIAKIPDYPPSIKGIFSLRGAYIYVIDLRLRLGKPEIGYTDRTGIIVNRVNYHQLAFIVDEVEGVIDIPNEAISTSPKLGYDDVDRFLTGIARITDDDSKEKIVLCLNAKKVLYEDDFQNLI